MLILTSSSHESVCNTFHPLGFIDPGLAETETLLASDGDNNESIRMAVLAWIRSCKFLFLYTPLVKWF